MRVLARAGGRELAALENGPENDLHLEHRKPGAEAAADSTPERDPGERLGRSRTEEPLGAKLHGIGIDVGAVVGEQDARRYHGPGCIQRVAEGCRLNQGTAGVDDDRSQPHGLSNDCPDVVAAAVGEVGAQSIHRNRVMQQEVERPRQRGRGRVVAGEHHREQVVEYLVVVEVIAVALGSEQERQDIGAYIEVGGVPTLADLLGENRKHVRAEPLEARPRAVASQLSTEAGVEDEQRACLTEERAQAVAQIVEPVGRVDAEGDPQDDLEGDRLKAGVQRELSTDWPRREIAPSNGLHRVGVVLEGVRSKGASEQPPLTGVNLAVLAEHGLRPRNGSSIVLSVTNSCGFKPKTSRIEAASVTTTLVPSAARRSVNRSPIFPVAPVQVALGPESVAERLQRGRQSRAGDVSCPGCEQRRASRRAYTRRLNMRLN